MAFTWGAARAGCVVVPINPHFKEREMAYVLNDSAVRVILVDAISAPTVSAVRPQVASLTRVVSAPARVPGADASAAEMLATHTTVAAIEDCDPSSEVMRVYTSGTEGVTKGARHTHDTIHYITSAWIDNVHKMQPDDICLCPLPLFLMFANDMLFPALDIGATTVLVTGFTSGAEILDLMTRDAVTWYGGVPTTYLRMIQDHDPARHRIQLRQSFSAGAKMPADRIQEWERISGGPFIEFYGSTEVPTLSQVMEMPRKAGSVGWPIGNLQVHLVDDYDEPVPDGQPGEIVVRGALVCEGYWNQPEGTARAFRGGWFHTGDIAVRDRNGEYTIVDRKKDMIIRGGVNLYPAEIESTLYEHPQVAMCAVVGRPHADLGEVPIAFVQPISTTPVRPDDLREFMRERLAHVKCPEEFRIVDSLPMNENGKLLKRVLRQQLRDEGPNRLEVQPGG